MDFKMTSRKDDMISLCYLLFYILNEFEMPGIGLDSLDKLNDDTVDTPQVFKIIKKFKTQTSMFKMSQLIELKTNKNL
jgi:hypothetical protein